MITMHFSKLKIWEKAMILAKLIYELTRTFPKEEIYGLTAQMRRAAISIPSNIAEGSQRTTLKDFANFLLIAKGSLAELETQTLLAYNLGLIGQLSLNDVQKIAQELNKMIYAFWKKIDTSDR